MSSDEFGPYSKSQWPLPAQAAITAVVTPVAPALDAKECKILSELPRNGRRIYKKYLNKGMTPSQALSEAMKVWS